MEEQITEKVAAKEAELNATYDERLRNYEDRLVTSFSKLLCADADMVHFTENVICRSRSLPLSNNFETCA